MSGGTFNYAYHRVENFCAELDKCREECKFDYEFNTLTAMMDLSNMCKEMARLMKSVEWMTSGDISEEDFVKDFRKYQST